MHVLASGEDGRLDPGNGSFWPASLPWGLGAAALQWSPLDGQGV